MPKDLPKDTPFASKDCDEAGLYPYDAEETAVWGTLFRRQMAFLPGRVMPAYLQGVAALGLTPDQVPQISDINARLNQLTGAGIKGVPAIIPPKQFFNLLAQRKFPIATFLRRREDMDYIQEPDLFHEVFGHCPLLSDNAYADFVQAIGQLGLALGKGYSWHLFRLFWFTVEFGMIKTPDGLRAYGAGIVSSPSEAKHATGPTAQMADFDLIQVLRTPYRIDIVQPLYFVIDSFEHLAALIHIDMKAAIDQAKRLGDAKPLFDPAP